VQQKHYRILQVVITYFKRDSICYVELLCLKLRCGQNGYNLIHTIVIENPKEEKKMEGLTFLQEFSSVRLSWSERIAC